MARGREEPVGEPGRAIDRRQFLKRAGVIGAGTALAGAFPRIASASPVRARLISYRLSTRGRESCNACKGQAANRYYRLKYFADIDRAHHHCNCRILRQPLGRRRWNKYFVRPNGTLRRVWDVRWRLLS